MKKQTIIWEENTPPPTNYIWVKPDEKPYAYNEETHKWEETTLPGGGGDEFPYEYQVVNFTVDVKAEDWTIKEGEAYCDIKLDNHIPLQYNTLIWGFLNNNSPSSLDIKDFSITIAELEGNVSFITVGKKITSIHIDGYFDETFTPPENFKLEFKNIIFV